MTGQISYQMGEVIKGLSPLKSLLTTTGRRTSIAVGIAFAVPTRHPGGHGLICARPRAESPVRWQISGAGPPGQPSTRERLARLEQYTPLPKLGFVKRDP